MASSATERGLWMPSPFGRLSRSHDGERLASWTPNDGADGEPKHGDRRSARHEVRLAPYPGPAQPDSEPICRSNDPLSPRLPARIPECAAFAEAMSLDRTSRAPERY